MIQVLHVATHKCNNTKPNVIGRQPNKVPRLTRSKGIVGLFDERLRSRQLQDVSRPPLVNWVLLAPVIYDIVHAVLDINRHWPTSTTINWDHNILA